MKVLWMDCYHLTWMILKNVLQVNGGCEKELDKGQSYPGKPRAMMSFIMGLEKTHGDYIDSLTDPDKGETD
jgi:hypothetical protein